jgi:hypothetical protein
LLELLPADLGEAGQKPFHRPATDSERFDVDPEVGPSRQPTRQLLGRDDSVAVLVDDCLYSGTSTPILDHSLSVRPGTGRTDHKRTRTQPHVATATRTAADGHGPSSAAGRRGINAG